MLHNKRLTAKEVTQINKNASMNKLLRHTSCLWQHQCLHISKASTQQSKMCSAQFPGIAVSRWLRKKIHLRMVLIMSCSFGLSTLPTKLLHGWTNQTLSAGQPAVFPLDANTSAEPAAQKESLFCIFTPQPTDRNVWEASSSGWQGPLDCCWPSVPAEQELSQRPHTDAKWVTEVHKDDWQHKGSDQEWL